MKVWKIWLTTVVVIVVLAGIALTLSVWNNLDSEWGTEAAAAQFALDHSPINQITGHHVFTADQAQEVFQGKDAFGRTWYAFVYGSPFVVKYIQSAGLKTSDEIAQEVSKSGWSSAVYRIGYVAPEDRSAFHPDSGVVWEVRARNQAGSEVYAYFDGVSGKRLWEYVLST